MDKEVGIQTSQGNLRGLLSVPLEAKGIVLFAHGSGSGRLSPRNQFVAKKLQQKKLATLLMDLLTEQEEAIDERTRWYRFDIDLLAERLVAVTEWVAAHEATKQLKIGYFGASTGAAAALKAAATLGDQIKAIVSRGGRPDLAEKVLSTVLAPTLLIVGECDPVVIELNKKAYDLLQVEKKLEIIPKATHLFEEPGTLEEVARIASLWFERLL
ncbi:MAG: dienelactone hydrolase family protein [Verrucomicrobia bacterium]|nr:dienelactone hydrolase family protein [Verrucomicrobiota bacterium]